MIYIVQYRNDEDPIGYIRIFKDFASAKDFRDFKAKIFKYTHIAVQILEV